MGIRASIDGLARDSTNNAYILSITGQKLGQQYDGNMTYFGNISVQAAYSAQCPLD